MAWTEAADVFNQFPETFVDKLTGGDDDVLDKLLVSAEAEVAAKLSRRYPSQVSLRTASDTIKSIVVVRTIMKLCNRNPLMGISKSIYEDIEFSKSLLDDIASGSADVPEWTRPAGMMTGNMQFESQTTFNDWVTERDELDA